MPKNRHIVLYYYQKSHTLLPPKKKKGRERERESKEFPGGPWVRTPCFDCMGHRIIPGQGTKKLHVFGMTKNRRKRLRIHYHKLRLQYPLLEMNRSSRQKISIDRVELNKSSIN